MNRLKKWRNVLRKCSSNLRIGLNKRIVYFCTIIVLGVVAAVFLIRNEIITDQKSKIVDDVSELIFSEESGFYEDDFDLTIRSKKGGTIYYTLDSSEPDETSYVYDGPIHISDASVNENIYSARDDASTGYYSDLIENYSEEPDPEYKVPSEKVDKCTIVRAVAIYDDGTKSDVKTTSYFVGFDNKPGYEGMNYISIVTDPDNLFDYEDGMYVTGKAFDEFIQSPEFGTEATKYWYQWLANYSEEYSAEKVANIQFYNTDGELELSQMAGIDIHGAGSRGYNPKALNLNVREEYDGNSYFKLNFFEDDLRTSKLVLFCGGNDYYTKARDYIVNTLTKDMNFTTVSFEPYVLFLDGEYWGVYFLNDKVSKDYLLHNYGVSKSNCVMFKEYKLSIGLEEDIELYQQLFTDFPEDCSNRDNYEIAKSMVDIDSAVDYLAVMCWISRTRDWPNANIGMWRSRESDTNNYCDCKWRFVFYDVNSSSISADLVETDSIGHAIDNHPIFASLMKNDEFRNRVLDRMLELSENEFSEERLDNITSKFRSLMAEPMKKNNERFFGGEPDGHSFDKEMREIEDFFKARREYIPQLVEQYR